MPISSINGEPITVGHVEGTLDAIQPFVSRYVDFESGAFSFADGEIVLTTNVKRGRHRFVCDYPATVSVAPDAPDGYTFTIYRFTGLALKSVATIHTPRMGGTEQSRFTMPDDGMPYVVTCYYGDGYSAMTSEQLKGASRCLVFTPSPREDGYVDSAIRMLSGRPVEIPLERGGFSPSTLKPTSDTNRARSVIIQVMAPVVLELHSTTLAMSVYKVGNVRLAHGVKRAVITELDADMRVSIYNADDNTQEVTAEEVASASLKMSRYVEKSAQPHTGRVMGIFEKFTVLGDSLSCGYTNKGGILHNSAEAKAARRNWPSYLIELELGRSLENVAVGGSTVREWRRDYVQTADVGTDCYLVGLGVNDVRQALAVGSSSDIASSKDGNADTFYGNYDYVIRTLFEYNQSAHVFAFTIPATESNAASYNVAIRHVASLYQRVHLIDLAEAYPDDYTTGMLDGMWNGHSVPMGYMVMASMIRTAINDYMVANYQMFFSSPWE